MTIKRVRVERSISHSRMNAEDFGSFQIQIKRNQEELEEYLKELDSWKSSMAKKESTVKSSDVDSSLSRDLPPIRNSLMQKRKIRKKKTKSTDVLKPKRISGYDFRAWDKFDVDKALEDAEKDASQSSYEEETDEEWEEERMKQQANLEKDHGNVYFKNGKYEEALQCYTKGVECDPANPILYANRAMALLKLDRFGAAERDCTDCILLDPAYVKAYMRRATARQSLGKKELALDDYKQVMKLEPDNKFAQKEVLALQKELRVDQPQGIVFSINKPVTECSKKPLLRLKIEEIDGNEVSKKLNSAISHTLAGQGEEKNRLESQSHELFSKFTLKPFQDSLQHQPFQDTTSLASPLISPAGIPKTNPCITSPSDIGKTSLALNRDAPASHNDNGHTDVSPKSAENPARNNHHRSEAVVSKSSTQISSQHDKISVPVSAARVPANSFQFLKDYRAIWRDSDKAFNYLRAIPPNQYPKLFGESLEADLLASLLDVFASRFLRDKINVKEHLQQLTKVKRFSMAVMLMSQRSRDVMKTLLSDLAEFPENTSEEMRDIRKVYEA